MSQPRDPDRLLPADPGTREVARHLYARVADAPIISPHGHVPVDLLVDDRPFPNAADLLVTHDHYVTRLLHSAGVDQAQLADADPRAVWRLFARHWHLFAGTATGYWLADELALLGVPEPSESTADALFDEIGAALATSAFRPRALFREFGIRVLATTDDPLDDLDGHAALARDGFRVVPTFRPDRYVDPDAAGFRDNVARLLGQQPATFAGYLSALEGRRQHFIARGAVSADHGVEEPVTVDLEPGEAERLFQRVLAGAADRGDRRTFLGHLLFQSARMSVDDGLVMTVHAGILRNHHTPTFERFGPDTGHDIPVATHFVRGLRPLLQRFGLEKDFHLVLFSADEAAYAREIAPLAGFYPSVYIGAPWWFLDAPDSIARFRAATTETAGFSRGSGFVDDTRAFLSIPVRHDMARRCDAAYLARLVVEGRMPRAAAERTIDDIVLDQPGRVFKL